jgi:hypothetical protein
MGESAFRTVFVADPWGVTWWPPVAAFLIAGALWLGAASKAKAFPAEPSWSPSFGLRWGPSVASLRATALLCVVVGVGAGAMTLRQHRRCSTPLDDPSVTVSVGQVTNFRPRPPGSGEVEEFTVGGAHFAYHLASASCGFRGAEALGDGVLRNGQWVRVFSRKGKILRLDARDDAR